MNEFEQLLRKQPLRAIPPEWRTEILATKRTTSRSKRVTPFHGAASTDSVAWWRQWLGPSPAAWAGLAAVWLVILAVNFSMRDELQAVEKSSLPPPREVIMALQQQERLLVELIGPPEGPAVVRQKPLPPQPRTESSNAILTA